MRTTRGAAAKEAAFLAKLDKENIPQQLTSPPATPAPLSKQSTSKKATPKSTITKAKSASNTEKNSVKAETKISSPIPKDEAQFSEQNGKTLQAKSAANEKKVAENAKVHAQANTKKRKRASAVKIETDPDELPHGLGRIVSSSEVKAKDVKDDIDPPAKKSHGEEVIVTKQDAEDIKSTVDTTTAASVIVEGSPTKRSRKKKANTYGVTLGETPYPDLIHPTPEECETVNDILSKKHGTVRMPESIPLPSLTVAGCGEVPCVLEALMRTLLSAHTSNGNAALAVQGLIKRFGILKTGISKGCIDWNAVRLAGRDEICEAIKRGGLAQTKSKCIAGILDMVYKENQDRRAAIAAKKENPLDAKPDIEEDTEAALIEKAAEKMLADSDALTLDYVHAMSAEAAFNKLITLPGIGVKTASCTLLFCMQRPSFAVDTHVFRLCKWLGWVPEKATRDTTFAHCDVRVPDGLKYSLHQLLIKHGKECGRCRAITGENSAGWDDRCPLEELVKRTGVRKGGVDSTKKKTKKGTKQDSEEEGEDLEMNEETNAKPGKGKKASATKFTKASPSKSKGRKVTPSDPTPTKSRSARKAASTKTTSIKATGGDEETESDAALSEPEDDDDEYIEE